MERSQVNSHGIRQKNLEKLKNQKTENRQKQTEISTEQNSRTEKQSDEETGGLRQKIQGTADQKKDGRQKKYLKC